MQTLSPKTHKKLSVTSWFHGTTFDQWENFCQNKVNISYNQRWAHELDFGYGFYMTDSEQRATDYMLRYIKNKVIPRQDILVLEFEFSPISFFDKEQCKVFEKFDDDFAEFVFHNRVNNQFGQNQHGYTWVYGGMSDSLPLQVIGDYNAGNLSKHQALEYLKKGTSFKQLSIHSQAIALSMFLKRALHLVVNEDLSTYVQELNCDEYNSGKTQSICRK